MARLLPHLGTKELAHFAQRSLPPLFDAGILPPPPPELSSQDKLAAQVGPREAARRAEALSATAKACNGNIATMRLLVDAANLVRASASVRIHLTGCSFSHALYAVAGWNLP
jgi:hypothetical protein